MQEYLETMDLDKPPGEQGQRMMMSRLHYYLAKQSKRKLAKLTSSGSAPGPERSKAATDPNADRDDGVSEALKKKDKERQARQASRRRVRGGGPAVQTPRETGGPAFIEPYGFPCFLFPPHSTDNLP